MVITRNNRDTVVAAQTPELNSERASLSIIGEDDYSDDGEPTDGPSSWIPIPIKFILCFAVVNYITRLLGSTRVSSHTTNSDFVYPLWDIFNEDERPLMLEVMAWVDETNQISSKIPEPLMSWRIKNQLTWWDILDTPEETHVEIMLPPNLRDTLKSLQCDPERCRTNANLYFHLLTRPLAPDSASVEDRQRLESFYTHDSVPLIRFLPEREGKEQHHRHHHHHDNDSSIDDIKQPVATPHALHRVDCRVIHMNEPLTLREFNLPAVQQRSQKGLLPSYMDVDDYLPSTVKRRYKEMRTRYGNSHGGYYEPITWANDFWNVDEQFKSLRDKEVLELTITVSTQSLWSYLSITNIANLMTPGTNAGSMAQLHEFTGSEINVFKHMFMNRSPYYILFSALFMALHTIFSGLALKSEVAFWRETTSLKGISALSLLVTFVSELIIGLYLLDSEKSSKLILFEVLMGLAISFWKWTRSFTIRFGTEYFLWTKIEYLPGYNDEDETKKHDRYALKALSVGVIPLCIGYAVYSYYYRVHRSLYSYVLDWLAGVVYTFGFIFMIPQLYINYKLQSVDHLPFNAIIYKSLNTFVDDVASFLIDMPLLHRLACFRDDIIFIAYLVQRWLYRVDKTRVGEFWAGEAVKNKDE